MEVDRAWLQEIWSGADCDLNRAINHVIDTPEHKVKRAKPGGGGHNRQNLRVPAWRHGGNVAPRYFTIAVIFLGTALFARAVVSGDFPSSQSLYERKWGGC